MLCPVCGCQQRKTDVCVQCHAPLFAKVVKTQAPKPEGSTLASKTRVSQSDTPQPAEASVPKYSKPKKTLQALTGKKPEVGEKSLDDILVTTTQRVEGKRIAKYYGLIHTDVLIDAREPASAASRVEMHRKGVKSAVVEAIQGLRREAALLKADAVVATVFDYQRVDSRTILLSVVGTAVSLKDP